MKIFSSVFSLYQKVVLSSIHMCSIDTVTIIFDQEGNPQVIIAACAHLLAQTTHPYTRIHTYAEAGRVIWPGWELRRIIKFEK